MSELSLPEDCTDDERLITLWEQGLLSDADLADALA
jgi:hypothetical protein